MSSTALPRGRRRAARGLLALPRVSWPTVARAVWLTYQTAVCVFVLVFSLHYLIMGS